MRALRHASALVRRSPARICVPGLYCLVSFVYFGLPVVAHPGSRTIGTGTDPYGFVWAFAWWPHAIGHGQNPFTTHAIWAPEGLNLTWTTSVPALALLFSPLTAAAGPLVSFNVAAILMPALAAWTAYLLCRRLTGRLWPSLAGGYLFGFSAYTLGHEQAHLHLTAGFVVPLTALVVLGYLDGTIGARRLTAALALVLAFELGTSTEALFTLTLAIVAATCLGFALVPSRRPALRSLARPLAAAFLIAGVLTAPFVYYAISGFQSGAVNRTDLFPGDVLNLVVPGGLEALRGTWASRVAAHFLGNDSENVLYLGVPTLAIVCWYLIRERARASSRFLAAALALATVASLGSAVIVEGRRVGPGPWALVGHFPLFDNVITPRLAVYSALVASVTVALWGASTRTAWTVRTVALALAVMSLIPRAFGHSPWEVTAFTPRFFAGGGAASRCLRPGDNVLVLPNVSDALLWQAANGFRFRLAVDDFQPLAPAGIRERTVAVDIQRNVAPAGRGAALLRFARANAVSEIVVVEALPGPWAAALRQVARPIRVEGVLLYPVTPVRPGAGCA